MSTSLHFPKSSRLKSEKLIGQLFKGGQSYVAYPFRVVWQPLEPPFPANFQADDPVQVAFSVPKRVFKTAVARNRIKRQMREAWRLNRHLFLEKTGGVPLSLMLIYVAKEGLAYADFTAGVLKAVRKFPS